MWFNRSKSSLQALPIFSLVMSISQQIHNYPHKFPSIFRGWEGSDTLISNYEWLWMVAQRPSTTKWKVIIQANIWYHWYYILATISPHHVTPDVMWKHTIGLWKCTGWPFHDLDTRSRLWHQWAWAKPFFACLHDKVRTTHLITTKCRSFIALVTVISWSDFGEVLFETGILANFL